MTRNSVGETKYFSKTFDRNIPAEESNAAVQRQDEPVQTVPEASVTMAGPQ
jgi:hypothetical protein